MKQIKDKNKVIDQELIQEAISKLDDCSNITFINLKVLTLSYKNIKKIQNLEGLNSLEKVQLDNNLIEKIEGLNHLTKLKWLDLSFNCISKIENLENLTELTDLSLFHNLIKQINDITYLKKLSILSLGNNDIVNYNPMIRILKKLDNLEVLNISDNPFTKDTDYENYILVNMKNLVYLDYIYVRDNEKKNQEEDKYKIEEEEEGKEDKYKIEEEEKWQLSNIYLLDLFSYHDDLINNSNELKSLLDLKNAFKESTSKLKDNFKKTIKELKKELETPILEEKIIKENFQKALVEMINCSKSKTNSTLKNYYYLKKKALKIIEESFHSHDKYNKDLKNQLKLLEDNLIRIEVHLANDCLKSHEILTIELTNVYDNIKNIVLNNKLNNNLSYIEEFIKKFTEECNKEVEDFLNLKPRTDENNIEENLDVKIIEQEDYDFIEQILNPVIDKEEAKSTINSIKESLENKHNEIVKKIRQDLTNQKNRFTNKILKEIQDRNRVNIINIINLIKEENTYWKDKLEN